MNPKKIFPLLFSLLFITSIYSAPPTANILKIDGFPDNAPLPVFSYAKDGNLTIDFNVTDTDASDRQKLLVDINFSTSKTPGTGGAIIADLNIFKNSSKCANTTWQQTRCRWDLNIHSVLVPDGNYYIHITITDLNSTGRDTSDNNFMVDNTAPKTVADYNAAWQNRNANVKFTCSDGAGSGCSLTGIRKDTNNTSGVSLAPPITGKAADLNAFFIQDGNWAVDFNSTDAVGNIEGKNIIFVLIDKTPPTITDDVNENAWQRANVNVHISVSDELSGVREVWIVKDGKPEKFTSNFSELSAFFNTDGNHSLDINALDNAGNMKTHPRKHVLVDKSAPSFRAIPAQFLDISQKARFLVDLFEFASDEAVFLQDLRFSIASQADTSVISCFIEQERFVSCTTPKKFGSSRITVRAVDRAMRLGETAFDIIVPELALSFGFEEAAITNNDSAGLGVRVKNRGNSQKCFSLEIEGGTGFINGSFSNPSDCLNPNEETEKTFTITTINAPAGVYAITIIPTVDGKQASRRSFNLRVSTFSEIEIVKFSQSVCRTGFQEISLQIKNNSGKFKTVELQASNEALLPGIEPRKIRLDAFESRFVAIKIFSNENTATGNYRVSVFAKTSTEIVKEEIPIQIVDCREQRRASFSVSLQATGCIEIDKNSGATVNYAIENRSSREQEVNVSLASVLPSNVKQSLVALEPLQARQASFDVNATARTKAADYNLSLVVWNREQSIEKSACVRVRKARVSEVQLLNNNLAVEQGSNIVFTLLVSNLGDFENNYNISAPTSIPGVFAALSHQGFSLQKNTEREVYISVSATEAARPGSFDMNALVSTEGQSLVKQLRFEVKEKRIKPARISITVYPIQVRMLPNDEKSLVVELRNDSQERVSGITLGIAALPPSIESKQASGIELLGRETRRITLKAVSKQAGIGSYNALLELAGHSIKETRGIEFQIAQPGTTALPEQAPAAPPTGFVVLNIAGTRFSEIFGVAALVALVLIILLIFIGLIAGTTRTTRETWMQRRW